MNDYQEASNVVSVKSISIGQEDLLLLLLCFLGLPAKRRECHPHTLCSLGGAIKKSEANPSDRLIIGKKKK